MVKAKMNYQSLCTEIEATYTELRFRTNNYAHDMAVRALGQEYIDRARSDPSQKFIICSDDYCYTSRMRFPDQPANVHQNTDAQTSPARECEAETVDVVQDTVEPDTAAFALHTTKARAKARALAELKLEEMDVREQQMQLKLDKIQAKRDLLELNED